MNKNIDDIFKEQLKSLKVSPSPKVWANITANLPQKHKRMILPIWWFSGIAAIFIITLFLFSFFYTNKKRPSLKKEIITVSSPKVKEKTDVVNTSKNNKSVLVNIDKKYPKETIITKNKLKNISKKIIKKKKKLFDTKIAKNITNQNIKNVIEKKIVNKITVKKDSLTFIIKPKKYVVAEVFKKKRTPKTLAKKETKKWSLTPVIALLYSNSFSGNSPLDKALANNPTKGTNNFSYGVKIAYQIGSKWEIQSGIHVQKTDYVNNNLSIISNVSGIGLSALESKTSFSLTTTITNYKETPYFLADAKIISSAANITQTYGYIEVPLEIKYTFLERRKFHSKLVTGFSSLFLNENNVFVNSSVLSQKIGEANNLNTINFSANLGVDFNYSINNNFILNINPMFKAQLNTFSKNSNGFKPYVLGFYSGIKYLF